MDCETHLYFLWDALRLYPKERDRFKQIAAELRILVCETRKNKPLLLNLMDEFAFVYEVQPPGMSASGPPLKPQPLPMVGWREDPIHAEISERLSRAIESGDTAQMKEIDRRLAELAKPIPFREWINRGLAVFIAPYDYSHRELVLAIAQQLGSSHEDDSVEEPILRLQQIYIGGQRGDLAPMIVFANDVLSVGVAFIRHVESDHSFQPRYFRGKAV
ncbi:MAG: hypothetical protein AB7G48_17240 [Nitrospiraceae bacterium]